MEYLLAILVLIGIYALTTILSGIFGLIVPISYLFFRIHTWNRIINNWYWWRTR